MQCSGGYCCPDREHGTATCAVACHRLKAGAACVRHEQCELGMCENSVCGGVPANCLNCPPGAYCDGGFCRPACEFQRCGDDHGVPCGQCAEGNLCEQGSCVAPLCANQECGVDRGTDCGGCPSGKVCHIGSCLPCGPERGNCEGSFYYVCGSDGFTLETSECQNSGLTCTPGGCAQLREESVAVTSAFMVEDASLCGNVYHVDRGVVLQKVTQELGRGAAQDARWVIYRSQSADGGFTLVADALTASTQSGSNESPELDAYLEPTFYYYFLGLAAANVTYTLGAASSATTLSFGTVVTGGCVSSSDANSASPPGQLPAFSRAGIAPQTLTTATYP